MQKTPTSVAGLLGPISDPAVGLRSPAGRSHCMSPTTPTVPTPTRKLRPEEEQKTRRQPPYHVVLLDDEDPSLAQLDAYPRAVNA